MSEAPGSRRRSGRGWSTTFLALVLAIATVAAACGSSKKADTTAGTTPEADVATANVVKPASGPPKSGGRLVFALDSETDGWNPTSNRWSIAGETVANAIFDPLAAWDQDYQAQPYLAQAFEHDDTYRTWTIRLRPGVTFHDGEPVDAAAVKHDLDAIKTSVLTSATFKPIESIDVVDPTTLQVHMADVSGGNGWVAFPASLTAQAGMVASPKMLDDTANGSRNPIGSGPFAFEKWTPDTELSVKKNPSYWAKDASGGALPYLDEVDFKPISEPQSAYDALPGRRREHAHDQQPDHPDQAPGRCRERRHPVRAVGG